MKDNCFEIMVKDMASENALEKVRYSGKIENIVKIDEFLKKVPLLLSSIGCDIDAEQGFPKEGEETLLKIYPSSFYRGSEVKVLENKELGQFDAEFDKVVYEGDVAKPVPYSVFKILGKEEKPLYPGIAICLSKKD